MSVFQGPLLKLFSFMSGSVSAIELVISFFAVFVIILLVFPIHECSHGLAAKLLGDDTAERQGRLTLNPLSHIDPMGALMMLIFPIGWARPVPVNISRCHKVKGRTAMAITAAAGPLSNLIMTYIFVIIYKIIYYSIDPQVYLDNSAMQYLPLAFLYIANLNLYLGLFNLLPIPPLDGSKILFSFLKPKWTYFFARYQQIITMAFFALLFFTPVFRTILSGLSGILMNVFDFLSGFIDILMA